MPVHVKKTMFFLLLLHFFPLIDPTEEKYEMGGATTGGN